jgi:N-acetylglucosaminyldiphosphoundecaprenol N-acetyl-beta-D-mannosaminyltransferase
LATLPASPPSSEFMDLDAGVFMDIAFARMAMPSVIRMVGERQEGAPFAYVVTPNVDHVVRLQRIRSDLWPVYRSAWATLCDSKILAILARGMGVTLPVIPGSDLTQQIFEHVVKPADKIAIIGSNADLIAGLADLYGLKKVHHYDPPMGFIKDPVEVTRAVRFIVETRARYCFLAVGSPQQEILAYRVKQAGGARGIGFCVGASLDFLTGVQKRAPLFMRLLAMEWLHRLLSDPARMWRRYLYDGPGIFQIARDWKRGARS